MRAAIESSDSSKLDKALKNANVMAAATLLELDPCKMDYNSFKALNQNTCGQNGGTSALKYDEYQNLSQKFQNRAKDIFLENFLYEISTIAEAFKDDINLLEKQKQSEQDRLTEEKNAKTIQASNDLSGLDNIFTNRVGRGFFKIFGGGSLV